MKYFISIFIFIIVGFSLFSMGSSKVKKESEPVKEKQEALMDQYGFEHDTFDISGNTLGISFIGHGTLMMEYDNKVIHIDPVSKEGDYSKLPKADIILITHAHGDHLDSSVIDKIKKENTLIIGTEECITKLKEGKI